MQALLKPLILKADAASSEAHADEVALKLEVEISLAVIAPDDISIPLVVGGHFGMVISLAGKKDPCLKLSKTKIPKHWEARWLLFTGTCAAGRTSDMLTG